MLGTPSVDVTNLKTQTVVVPARVGRVNLFTVLSMRFCFCTIRELDKSFWAILWKVAKHDGDSLRIIAGGVAICVLCIVLAFAAPLTLEILQGILPISTSDIAPSSSLLSASSPRLRFQSGLRAVSRPFSSDSSGWGGWGLSPRFGGYLITMAFGPNVRAVGSPSEQASVTPRLQC